MNELDWKQTLRFSVNEDHISPWPAKVGEQVVIKCRIHKDSPVAKFYLRCAPEGSGRFWPLEKVSEGDFYAEYAIQIPLEWRRFAFRFVIVTDDNHVFFFNNKGVLNYEPPAQHDHVLIAEHDIPEWVEQRVFYQIFPDRFANGNPERNHQEGEVSTTGDKIVVKQWGDAPEGGFDFFNGDVEGITSKVEYLSRLGVNAVYLNPIFTAPSNHRYDLEDYYGIDRFVGDEASVIQMITRMHDADIKIIIDGVFNHVGWGHKWFNRFGTHEEVGAYQSEESEYASFFYFNEHPHDYEGWFGFESLPKLNFNSPKLRDYLYGKPNSVMKYWLAAPFHLDGWRFDVANMTARLGTYQEGLEVWREVKDSIRKDYPDAYLLGEHFYDGSDLCQGDALDGVMNYMGFYYPVCYWLQGKVDVNAEGGRQFFPAENYDAFACVEQMKNYFAQIPEQHARVMLNLLNSHDRPRLNTLLDLDESKLAAARVMLFTFPGVPSIYYGEEIGLEGGADPDCRRCMPWDEAEWDKSLLAEYQWLIKLRKESAVLHRGELTWLLVESDTIVYSRILNGECVLCVATSDAAHGKNITLPVWKLGKINGLAKVLRDGSHASNVKNGQLTLPKTSRIYSLS